MVGINTCTETLVGIYRYIDILGIIQPYSSTVVISPCSSCVSVLSNLLNPPEVIQADFQDKEIIIILNLHHIISRLEYSVETNICSHSVILYGLCC